MSAQKSVVSFLSSERMLGSFSTSKKPQFHLKLLMVELKVWDMATRSLNMVPLKMEAAAGAFVLKLRIGEADTKLVREWR